MKKIKLVATVAPSSKVREEVLAAYGDCNECQKIKLPEGRNLNFRASEPVDGATLKALFAEAVPGGYNNFCEASVVAVVEMFGESAQYTIAREGSPCIYVKTPKRAWLDRVRLDADEFSVEVGGEFRVWWD